MRRIAILPVLLPLLLVQGGCSVLPFLFDGSEVVRVRNHTDATIDCDVREGSEHLADFGDTHIHAGDSEDIAYGPNTFNPRLYVWYLGRRHIYDIDPDWLGWDEVVVEEGDFPPAAAN